MFAKHDPLPDVAAMTAGGVKYTYSGEVHDLADLSVDERNPVSGGMGTAKNQRAFDHELFYEWHPDILIGSYADSFEKGVFQGLLSDWKFRERYVKGELWYNNEIFFAYFSRDFINGLEDGHYVFNQDLQYALETEDWQDASVDLPAEVLGGTGDHRSAARSAWSLPVRW
jgi:hypothetical protein